jgi:hypothetical protein
MFYPLYRAFQKELYNFESLYKFIHRIGTGVFFNCHNVAKHKALSGIVTVELDFHWSYRVFEK